MIVVNGPTPDFLVPYSGDTPLAGAKSPRAETVEDLIKILLTIRSRFGNTAVRCSLSWGSNALWASSEATERIEKLEGAIKSALEYCELVNGANVDYDDIKAVRRRLNKALKK